MSVGTGNQMVCGSNPVRSKLLSTVRLTLPALVATILGVACSTGANPPPVPTIVAPGATVAPPAPVELAPSIAPLGTIAPTDAPASAFTFPPTSTAIPRAEGDMAQAVLYNHTATLLEDGRVLVTGGQTVATSLLPPAGLVSAEIYDPSTGRWSPTRPMFEPRRHHGAVLLEDGRVLVSGGLTDDHERSPIDASVTWVRSLSSAEVFDPSSETWSLVSDMPEKTDLRVSPQYNRPVISLEKIEDSNVLAISGLGSWGDSSSLLPEPGLLLAFLPIRLSMRHVRPT